MKAADLHGELQRSAGISGKGRRLVANALLNCFPGEPSPVNMQVSEQRQSVTNHIAVLEEESSILHTEARNTGKPLYTTSRHLRLQTALFTLGRKGPNKSHVLPSVMCNTREDTAANCSHISSRQR